MNSYIVYFELFGRKMKTLVDAPSKSEAKKVVKNKIIFHKIDGEEDVANESVKNFDLDELKDILRIR